MRILALFIIFLMLVGCNKPDPNPELKDEIYADLNNQLALLTHEMEAEEKTLEEHKKVLKEVVPQTGQIKYAQKRVFESEARIALQKQNLKWLKLRIEERLKYTKRKYAEAFKKGEPWPDKAEFEQYADEMKLRRAKKEWDVNERMKEAGVSPSKKAGEKGGAEKKKEGGEGKAGGEAKPEGEAKAGGH